MDSPKVSSSENQGGTPCADVKKSSWFTPCRRLGLKRKSSTPSSEVLSIGGTPNSSFKSHRQSFQTPTKISEKPASHVNSVKVTDTMDDSSVDSLDAIKKQCTFNTPSYKRRAMVNSDSTKKTSSLTTRKVLSNTLSITPVRPIIEAVQLVDVTPEKLELLRVQVKEKEERVNALKLTQLYKRKQDMCTLSQLTQKWLTGCQDALRQLHEKTTSLGYQHTMSELLQQLRIPVALVHYDPELEDFEE